MLRGAGAMWLAHWFGCGAAGRWRVAGAGEPAVLALALLAALVDGRHVCSTARCRAAGWRRSAAISTCSTQRCGARRDPRDGWTDVRCTSAGSGCSPRCSPTACTSAIDRAALWDTSWAGVVFLVAVTGGARAATAWAGRAARADAQGPALAARSAPPRLLVGRRAAAGRADVYGGRVRDRPVARG